MTTKNKKYIVKRQNKQNDKAPNLKISKLAIVSRDYNKRFANRYKDFSYIFPDLLKQLDENECDTILFSLQSIKMRKSFIPISSIQLKNIKAVLYEEFTTKKTRYVVNYKTNEGWREYTFYQVFGKLSEMTKSKMYDFVNSEIPIRILGNSCVLLCGETNGVKYSRKDEKVHDNFGLRKAIPKHVNLILNPIHDRMIRYEMPLKRQYLSENNRWVVSVWNKGKKCKDGKARDGKSPAWSVFYNGKEIIVEQVQNNLGIEIGILNLKNFTEDEI